MSTKVVVIGREFDATERTIEAGAAGDAVRLMRSPEYLDGNHPLHAAAVQRVQELFRVVHGVQEVGS